MLNAQSCCWYSSDVFFLFFFYNSAIIVLLFVIEDEHQQAVEGQDENAPVRHLLTGWPNVNDWAPLVKTWQRLTADQTSVWEPRVRCIYTNSQVICESGWCSGAWSPLTHADHKPAAPFYWKLNHVHRWGKTSDSQKSCSFRTKINWNSGAKTGPFMAALLMWK